MFLTQVMQALEPAKSSSMKHDAFQTKSMSMSSHHSGSDHHISFKRGQSIDANVMGETVNSMQELALVMTDIQEGLTATGSDWPTRVNHNTIVY